MSNYASKVMLILNITPDSFSDGGVYADNLAKVISKVREALADGVRIFDIGAESTRPNATFVTADEEIARLAPVVDALYQLKSHYDIQISLDSYKSEVIEYFLNKIDIVNDVSNKLPLDLIKIITQQNKKHVLMHSLTVPADPHVVIENVDVTAELMVWFGDKLAEYLHHGINRENIILDLGIGFNKTSTQSWQLLRDVAKFKQFGCEILIGHSRKRFLDNVTKQEFAKRDMETAVVSDYLANQGVAYIRTHEYAEYLMISKINTQLSGGYHE